MSVNCSREQEHSAFPCLVVSSLAKVPQRNFERCEVGGPFSPVNFIKGESFKPQQASGSQKVFLSQLQALWVQGETIVSKESPRASGRRTTSPRHGGAYLSFQHLRGIGRRIPSSRPVWDLYQDLSSKIKEGKEGGREREKKGGRKKDRKKERKKSIFSILYSLPSQRARK